MLLASCSPPSPDPIGGPLEQEIRQGWTVAESTPETASQEPVSAGLEFPLIPMDSRGFDAFLKKHVDEQQGVIDYAGAQGDRGALESYLNQLREVDFSKRSRSDQKAIWINAYNAYTIQLILDNHGEISSIKDLSAPWDLKFCQVGARTLSLNDIEHRILRPLYGDSRIHFAVNCASKSCPVLRAFAFEGPKIEEQLKDVTTSTLQDPRYVSVNDSGQVAITRLMDWYQEDFVKESGSLRNYLKLYVTEPVSKSLDEGAKIVFKDYDWTLNEKS